MLNLKKLPAAIKTCNCVRWIKHNHMTYILCDHFILKTTQEIEGAALSTLVKLLGAVPNEGAGIGIKYSVKQELTPEEIKSTIAILENSQEDKTLIFTNLLHQSDKQLLSVFHLSDNQYVYANKIYVDMIDIYEKGTAITGNSSTSPIYFTSDKEKMMVLPVKLLEKPIYLK